MSLDASRTAPRPKRPAPSETRQRLEHARTSRTEQLRALDAGGHSADDHLLSVQRDAIRRVLTEIDEAYARLDGGTYGTCLGCSKPVPPERLEILPYTRYCVPCQSRAAA